MHDNRFQLAQINLARLIAPLSDPTMAEFVANLGPINALGDTSPGFVWRLQTEHGDATALRPYSDDRIIINLSVWQDLALASRVRVSKRTCARDETPPGMVRAVDGCVHRAGGYLRAIVRRSRKAWIAWSI
jgi:hypothetical protein